MLIDAAVDGPGFSLARTALAARGGWGVASACSSRPISRSAKRSG